MVARRSDCQRPEEPVLLTIRHRTTYRYRQPVAFGEHRMMFRPRESPDLRLLDMQLAIDPEPVGLRSTEDGYGNHIGIAVFSGRAHRLSFECITRLEHAPQASDFSFAVPHETDAALCYSPAELTALARYLARDPAERDTAVHAFAQRVVGTEAARGPWPLLCALSDGIHRGFTYRRREAQGIQTPMETLQLGHGACRDFAVLMIAAARSLGFAARFASGYLTSVIEDPDSDAATAPDYTGGNTHAWTQVYLPRVGWMDFDPTSGTIGPQRLVAVAVAVTPEEAIPLQGTFLGFPSDNIGMDVAVTITASPAPSESSAL